LGGDAVAAPHECVDSYARGEINRHDAELERHKRTIRDVRDEAAEEMGRLFRELVDHKLDFQHLCKFMNCPPRVQDNRANGTFREKSPSLAELVEEATNPGIPSNPIKALVERHVGKAVIRVAIFVAGIGAALGVEHLIMALVHR
jgi:hypothetical protein